MQSLLDTTETFKTLRRGETVEGTIAQISSESILVHTGSKSEGVIPTREMRSLTPEALSQLKVGDSIMVAVLQTEGDEGQAVLSLDRARSEGGWHKLQKCLEGGEIVEAQVIGYNRGGAIVNAEDIRGFVPLSQLATLPENSANSETDSPLALLVGKQLRVKILEVDRQRNRVILSERLALREWRQQQKERLLNELTEGEIVRGTVSGVAPFGAFVDLGGADGLIHISELSWESVSAVDQVAKMGDRVEVMILKVDKENSRIALSLKRLQPEPWAQAFEEYREGQIVKGTVTRLTNFGAFARLESGAEGLIHISELADRHLHHPKEAINEGDVVNLKILRIEPERHRIALSLKQVEEAEALEWIAKAQMSQSLESSPRGVVNG